MSKALPSALCLVGTSTPAVRSCLSLLREARPFNSLTPSAALSACPVSLASPSPPSSLDDVLAAVEASACSTRVIMEANAKDMREFMKTQKRHAAEMNAKIDSLASEVHGQKAKIDSLTTEVYGQLALLSFRLECHSAKFDGVVAATQGLVADVEGLTRAHERLEARCPVVESAASVADGQLLNLATSVQELQDQASVASTSTAAIRQSCDRNAALLDKLGRLQRGHELLVTGLPVIPDVSSLGLASRIAESINESISPSTRNLLDQVRRFARHNGYKHAWAWRDLFHLKKDDAADPIRVRSFADLPHARR